MKLTLGEIARRCDLVVRGDESVEITGLARISDASPGQLTFLFSSAYRHHLPVTRASAVVLREEDLDDCSIPAIVSSEPRLTWAKIAAFFDPLPTPNREHHATAVIAPTASIGEGATIGPNVVIEGNAVIGDNVVIGAGCFVGEGTSVGKDTRLFANVTLYHGVSIGERTIVHSGAVIGADGFGFEFDRRTLSLAKIPQIYGVRIGNDVEIGAGTTIDRGALNDTVIGNGVKLDNQIQVGHGVSIGDHTVMSGCTAVAGSTKIGSYCLIGGGVGIIDNIEVADRVEITAMTLVSRSITESGRYSSGTGLLPSKAWKRSVVGFARLDDLLRRLRRLERKI